MTVIIQLMKINEFIEGQQNKTHLPKLLRNQSSSLQKQSSPFAMPEDSEIFRMKQKQKDRKRDIKAQTDKLKIWQKGVKKSGITIKQLNQLGKKQIDEQQNQAKISLIEAAKNAIKNRVKINEPMHDFISKKRETLLFQMLIDHKRQKINQFEQMTKLHRKGLQRAEKMLQQDMQAFNSYLNENKKQARDAIKKAELQTRQKNQKVAIIKQKLQIQADLTGKNMSKRETLQNLRKYKLFLQSLNPMITQQQRLNIEELIQKQQQQTQNFSTINANESLDDSSGEDEIFFKHPEQLMDVFHSLQESNLGLITNLKQMEQQIQETKSLAIKKKQIMIKKKNELITDKQQLLKQISQVEEDIDELKKTSNKDQISTSYRDLEQEIIRLAKQVQFVSPTQKNLAALEVLKDIQLNIERQLEQLNAAKRQKQSIIKDLQKDCFAEKRLRKRQKNEEQMQEEKNSKQRTDEQIQREKRKGRPIMARSVIKRQKKKKEAEIQEPEQQIKKRKYLLPD